jgi:hypothetical protein
MQQHCPMLVGLEKHGSACWSLYTTTWPDVGRYIQQHGPMLVAIYNNMARCWSVWKNMAPLVGRYIQQHGPMLVAHTALPNHGSSLLVTTHILAHFIFLINLIAF